MSAAGRQWAKGQDSSTGEQTMVAAPGAGYQFYVSKVAVGCLTAGAAGSKARVIAGTSGAGLGLVVEGVQIGSSRAFDYGGDDRKGISRGVPIGANKAIILEITTGGTYDWAVEYETKQINP